MTRRDPLLVKLEADRRERVSLRARYKAGNPTAAGHDRTIGMHVKVNTSGLTEAEAKQKNKQASAKYRKVLKKAAQDHPISLGDLRQRCLDITRRHV